LKNQTTQIFCNKPTKSEDFVLFPVCFVKFESTFHCQTGGNVKKSGLFLKKPVFDRVDRYRKYYSPQTNKKIKVLTPQNLEIPIAMSLWPKAFEWFNQYRNEGNTVTPQIFAWLVSFFVACCAHLPKWGHSVIVWN